MPELLYGLVDPLSEGYTLVLGDTDVLGVEAAFASDPIPFPFLLDYLHFHHQASGTAWAIQVYLADDADTSSGPTLSGTPLLRSKNPDNVPRNDYPAFPTPIDVTLEPRIIVPISGQRLKVHAQPAGVSGYFFMTAHLLPLLVAD